MRPYYHAIMFDFDGTLVDTMSEYATIASEEMAAMFGVPRETARQLYLETSGVPFFQQLDLIFGPDARNAECSRRFETRKAVFFDTVRFDEKTRVVLRRLRSLGLSMAVTSNNFQELVDRFFVHEPGLVDLVLGFGNGMSKGPTQFSRVIETFGIDRRHMIFAGDSIHDVRKGFAFGIDTVALSGTVARESFLSLFPSVRVIADLAELEGILGQDTPIIHQPRGST